MGGEGGGHKDSEKQDLQGDGQADGQHEQGAGGRAKGGEVVGGGGGGPGRVKLAVNRLESFGHLQNLPRFTKPSGRRGVKRDNLIQTRIESLVGRGPGYK